MSSETVRPKKTKVRYEFTHGIIAHPRLIQTEGYCWFSEVGERWIYKPFYQSEMYRVLPENLEEI